MALQGKGFLFDLDGTLVDSLAVVEYCWCLFGKEQGISDDEIKNYIHGKPALESLRHFMPTATEEEITTKFRWLEHLEATETAGIVALPGAVELLNRLNQLAIPWAIVTSGTVPIATARLHAAGLPEPKHWVTFEKVKRGKPAPDPFLLGAELLGLVPQQCMAVEDAPAGIHSALTAGCQVIVVHAPEGMPRRDEISLIIHSLQQLNIENNSSTGSFTLSVD